jgi:DNA-binding NarL/FixJ family response regulator
VEFFARERCLTGAETHVLRALCEGERPVEIARRCGVALSTVRTQISSLRLTTGASCINELVRIVTMLPPIVPVLN